MMELVLIIVRQTMNRDIQIMGRRGEYVVVRGQGAMNIKMKVHISIMWSSSLFVFDACLHFPLSLQL